MTTSLPFVLTDSEVKTPDNCSIASGDSSGSILSDDDYNTLTELDLNSPYNNFNFNSPYNNNNTNNESLKIQLNEFKNQNIKLKKLNKEYKNKVLNYSNTINDLRCQNSLLQSKIDTLKDDNNIILNEHKLKIYKYKTTNDLLKCQINDLKELIQLSQINYSNEETDSKIREEECQNNEKIENDISSELFKKNNELLNRIESLQNEKILLETNNNKMEMDLLNIKTKYEEQLTIINDLKKENEVLLDSKVNLEEQNDELAKQYGNNSNNNNINDEVRILLRRSSGVLIHQRSSVSCIDDSGLDNNEIYWLNYEDRLKYDEDNCQSSDNEGIDESRLRRPSIPDVIKEYLHLAASCVLLQFPKLSYIDSNYLITQCKLHNYKLNEFYDKMYEMCLNEFKNELNFKNNQILKEQKELNELNKQKNSIFYKITNYILKPDKMTQKDNHVIPFFSFSLPF